MEYLGVARDEFSAPDEEVGSYTSIILIVQVYLHLIKHYLGWYHGMEKLRHNVQWSVQAFQVQEQIDQ